jgi:hypothetical protein
MCASSLGGSAAEARKRARRGGKKPKPAPAATAPSPDAEADAPTEAVEGDEGKAAAPAADAKGGKKAAKGPKVMDFTGLAVEGKLRTPQLLYFLGRAKEELERASLENRSFMPELVRSVDEGEM